MALYTGLELLFNGVVKRKVPQMTQLAMTKILIIPTINVDGLQFIEDSWVKEHKIKPKRLNMNIKNKTCDPVMAGVDLNRNYDYMWGKGEGSGKIECETEYYAGVKPFSEPETRVMRDFLFSIKNVTKFVANFHSFGPALVIPDNANFPSTVPIKFPKMY